MGRFLFDNPLFNCKRYFVLTALPAVIMIALQPSLAHQQPTTIVLLDVNPDRVRTELQIPLGELELAFGHDVSEKPENLLGALNPQFRDYLISHIRPTTAADEAWTVKPTDMKIEQAEQTQIRTSNKSGIYRQKLDII